MAASERHIPNEWAPLRRVVVGHGRSMGAPPTMETAIDPTSKHHISAGTFPAQDLVERQLDQLAEALEREGVTVLRPENLDGVEQVFTRDVGMVIDGTLIRSRTIDERSHEWAGIEPLLGAKDWIEVPSDTHLEGGDVIVLDDALVVGVTRHAPWLDLQVVRSLPSALPFLEGLFPHREVIGIELHKDDADPLISALHLDCAYMPLATGEALICPEAFVHEDQLNTLMKRHSGSIEIDRSEAAQLQTNLLHIDPRTMLIDPRFERVGRALSAKGYRLVECPMDLVGRMGGLFRCTTLPLHRSR